MEQAAVASGELIFYPSKKSSLQQTRLGLWVGCVFTIPLLAFQSGNIGTALSSRSTWIIAAFVLGVCALVDHYLRKQMDEKSPLATITDSALLSSRLVGKIKALPWTDIAAVSVVRNQGMPSLQFELTETSSLRGNIGFWSSLNGKKIALPIQALSSDEQAKLLDAINHRLSFSRGQTSTNVQPNELAEEHAFQQQLEQLGPRPWVTYSLIAANLAIWLITVAAGASILTAPADKLLAWGGNATSAVQNGEWWRLLTATFLHSGLMHVAMNMIGLYSAGVMLERIYGPRLFAIIYFGSGLMGSALSLSYAAQQAVSVGASGAVFGVTGALLATYLLHRDKMPKAMGKQGISGLSFFILYSLLQGFSHKGIDNAAHIGGLVGGCVLAMILPVRFDMEKFLRTQSTRAAVAIAVAFAGTAGLALTAPHAALDQQRIFASNTLVSQAFQAFEAGMKAIQQEHADVLAGKLSEREADDRSRTVFAPQFRRISEMLAEVVLRPGDPREAMLEDVRKITTLMTETLAMDSVYPEGADKPVPANPERSAQIEKELTQVSAQFLKDLHALKELTGKNTKAP